MTFLFDPAKGLEALHALEKQWGGTAQQRLDADYARFAAAAGVDVPPAPKDLVTIAQKVDAEARAAVQVDRPNTGAIEPGAEPVAQGAARGAPPAPVPVASPSPAGSQG
jgi:penicillin-binding protein 2